MKPAHLRILLLAALAGSPSVRADDQPPLTVLAAASLRESMEEVGVLFRRETSWPLRFSFDGSGTLARQIEKGAPADIFVTAHPQWMDHLAGLGLLDASTRRVILRGHLVIAVRRDQAAPLAEPAHLTNFTRIALGDPATVPAGQYARQFLEKHDLWSALQPRLVFASNVRAALALVERGDADAAFVYDTDARLVPELEARYTVPDADHDPIIYEAAVLKDAPRRTGALRFFWTLETPEARAAFESAGFQVETEDERRKTEDRKPPTDH